MENTSESLSKFILVWYSMTSHMHDCVYTYIFFFWKKKSVTEEEENQFLEEKVMKEKRVCTSQEWRQIKMQSIQQYSDLSESEKQYITYVYEDMGTFYTWHFIFHAILKLILIIIAA